jgi:Family of unknown function (DUF5329)
LKIVRRGGIIALALLVSGVPGQLRAGEPARDAQREISHLLQYLEASKCAFYRNGTWHSSLEARVHLEEKYKTLRNRSRVSSAEDFLARAATASSVSGVPYQVRCGGQEPVESAKWLNSELMRYRSTSTGTEK